MKAHKALLKMRMKMLIVSMIAGTSFEWLGRKIYCKLNPIGTMLMYIISH